MTEVAQNTRKQLNPIVLVGNGYRSFVALDNGIILNFKLSRPYGGRIITITLNAWDLYDVKVERVGKKGIVYEVAEYTMVYFNQLDGFIIKGIAQSCER